MKQTAADKPVHSYQRKAAIVAGDRLAAYAYAQRARRMDDGPIDQEVLTEDLA